MVPPVISTADCGGTLARAEIAILNLTVPCAAGLLADEWRFSHLCADIYFGRGPITHDIRSFTGKVTDG